MPNPQWRFKGAKKSYNFIQLGKSSDVILILVITIIIMLNLMLVQTLSKMSLWSAERGAANYDFAAISKLCAWFLLSFSHSFLSILIFFSNSGHFLLMKMVVNAKFLHSLVLLPLEKVWFTASFKTSTNLW